MAAIAILIASTEPNLEALAIARNVTLMRETKKQFDSLDTMKHPAFIANGTITSTQNGWIGLATIP